MPAAAGMHAKLVKADFHGSIITGTLPLPPHSHFIYQLELFLIVRQSKNPCLVGLSGIVIHETENAFKVITKKDQLKSAPSSWPLCSTIIHLMKLIPLVLPKQNSIFAFAVPLFSTLPVSNPAPPAPKDLPTTIMDLPHIEFELYGNQFMFRAADRAGRKFKPKETIEL